MNNYRCEVGLQVTLEFLMNKSKQVDNDSGMPI